MWAYVIGGATIFGLIVGVFSVYNGRATREYIGELIKEETELNRRILERMDKTLLKLSEQHNAMVKLLKA